MCQFDRGDIPVFGSTFPKEAISLLTKRNGFKFQHLVKNNPGTENFDLVSFVDFANTVLNLANMEIPQLMFGALFLVEKIPAPHEFLFAARRRAYVLHKLSCSIHDKNFTYLRHFMPHLPYIQIGIINSDGKDSYRELRRVNNAGEMPRTGELMWHPKPAEELYDLQVDPHELTNWPLRPIMLECWLKCGDC